MRIFLMSLFTAAAFTLAAAPVVAQEDEAEVVSDSDAQSEQAGKALPEEASDEGRENSKEGLQRASEARENREDFGGDMSEQARERRSEGGQEADGERSTQDPQ